MLPQDDDKFVRDLGKFELDLVNKLLNTQNIVPKYDKQYLNKLIESYSNMILPLGSERYMYTFEGYSRALKAYTEDKYYSQGNNLAGYIRNLIQLEESMLRNIDR